MLSDAKDDREELKGGVVSPILGQIGMIGAQGHRFFPPAFQREVIGSVKP